MIRNAADVASTRVHAANATTRGASEDEMQSSCDELRDDVLEWHLGKWMQDERLAFTDRTRFALSFFHMTIDESSRK